MSKTTKTELTAPAVGSRLDRGVRRVVCAAIRADDGSLLLGIRHYSHDMHEQIAERREGWKFLHRSGDDQGLLTSAGST